MRVLTLKCNNYLIFTMKLLWTNPNSFCSSVAFRVHTLIHKLIYFLLFSIDQLSVAHYHLFLWIYKLVKDMSQHLITNYFYDGSNRSKVKLSVKFRSTFCTFMRLVRSFYKLHIEASDQYNELVFIFTLKILIVLVHWCHVRVCKHLLLDSIHRRNPPMCGS